MRNWYEPCGREQGKPPYGDPHDFQKSFDMADIDNFYDDKLGFTDAEDQLRDQSEEFKETVGDTDDEKKKTEQETEKKPKPCGCRR